jgi:lysozyme family protein
MEEIAEAIAAKGVEIRQLRRGDRGLTVMYLQALLRQHGYDCGLIDGAFGAGTEAAVRAAQEQAAVRVDGICGPATWALLTDPDAPELPDDDDQLPERPDEESREEQTQNTEQKEDELDMIREKLLEALDIIDRLKGGETE